jgi:hypothetical protein
MREGERIGDRFEIQARAGTGGMAVVYRALDVVSGDLVAVKLLLETGDIVRFEREARVLASLTHPHVVRYVSHGMADTGQPYLVMEWLPGESLKQRLERQVPSLVESVAMIQRVAGALGVAHARGIVHRDIKPSNLFLLNGATERIKVLDFGLAWLADGARTLTRTEQLMGTPGYMAPEQVRGKRVEIDARADVFALGCVLFECLTGQPAFSGTNTMALLAKLLLEEPPRVRALNPRVPAALDELLVQMMAKDPLDRPADGAAVVAALQGLDPSAQSEIAHSPMLAGISRSERRLVSIVATGVATGAAGMSGAAAGSGPGVAGGSGGSLGTKTPQPSRASQAGLQLPSMIRGTATRLGAHVEELMGGGAVAMLMGTGPATDQAARAARCALQIAAIAPGAPIALVTGWDEGMGRRPVGEVIDRAALLLEGSRRHAPEAGQPVVHIDEVTRALLDARFDVLETADHLVLRGEREGDDVARLLLGKPSPFVGRERELRYLVELVEESFAEPRPVAILMTSLAGMGKSRLGHELVHTLRSRHGNLVFAMGRGDPIGGGSAFTMLAALLRRVLDIAASDPVDEQRRKLVHTVRQHVGGADAGHVSEMVAEVLGLTLADDDSLRLRAARANAPSMAAQLQAACVAILRALAAVRPVLFVLEDLHWGDAPSVKLLDAALRELEGSPFAVLALARPEVREVFPHLWAERHLQELRLDALPRRAAAQLVKVALGDAIPAAQVAALVERANGNAFYLEEMVRAVAQGQARTLPATVLGMVEARLTGLEPEARRLLRAASIFGQSFSLSGALAVLGEERPDARASWLELVADLIAHEILMQREDPGGAGEDELAFRHVLLRDGAYAMLTERDRVAGHKRAGAWLLAVGEQNPLVLAEHFEQGGERAQAALAYHRVAEQALHAHDLAAALAHAARGLTLAPEVRAGSKPESKAESKPEAQTEVTPDAKTDAKPDAKTDPQAEIHAALHAVQAVAHFWGMDYARSYDSACQALALATPGSKAHWLALPFAVFSAWFTRQQEPFARLSDLLLATEPSPEMGGPMVTALSPVFAASLFAGAVDKAAACLRRMEQALTPHLARDPSIMGRVELSRSEWKRFVERDPWGALLHGRAALRAFEQAGDVSYQRIAVAMLVIDLTHYGAFEEAGELARREHDPGAQVGFAELWVAYTRAFLCTRSGQLDEALRLADFVEQHALAQGDWLVRAGARHVMVDSLLQRGDVEQAERAVTALGAPAELPIMAQPDVFAALARLRLVQRRPEEALRLAEQALAASRAVLPSIASIQEHARLVCAEAHHALGHQAAARDAIRDARDDLLARAFKIEDMSYRRSFLKHNALHARILTLAREWLGDRLERA